MDPIFLLTEMKDILLFILYYIIYITIMFVTMVIIWFFGTIFAAILGFGIEFLFRNILETNEKNRRQYQDWNHQEFIKKDFLSISTFTYNRVKFIKLIIYWSILLVGLLGIAIATKVYVKFTDNVLNVAMVYLLYSNPTVVTYVADFFARFAIHYYDFLRINDNFELNNPKYQLRYKVKGIQLFGVYAEVLNKILINKLSGEKIIRKSTLKKPNTLFTRKENLFIQKEERWYVTIPYHRLLSTDSSGRSLYNFSVIMTKN